MNAITPIVQPFVAKPDPLASGHMFRSRLIDLMARVEGWSNLYIESRGKKHPHLLGEKLKAVRLLAVAERDDMLAGRLDDIQPYVELRSAICHAMLTRPNSQIFCFRPSCATGVLRWRPIVMTEPEMTEALEQAEKLSSELIKCS